MHPQAEAELKRLVEHQLSVYDKYDQSGTEFMEIVVSVLVKLADKRSQSISQPALKYIAERLCTYLGRREVVNKMGSILGGIFTVTSRQALCDTISSMTEWLERTNESDPEKIARAFEQFNRYWSFYREEDTEAISGWGHLFQPKLE